MCCIKIYGIVVTNIPDYVRVSLGCCQLKGRGPSCVPLVDEVFCSLSESHNGCGGGGVRELEGRAIPRIAEV